MQGPKTLPCEVSQSTFKDEVLKEGELTMIKAHSMRDSRDSWRTFALPRPDLWYLVACIHDVAYLTFETVPLQNNLHPHFTRGKAHIIQGCRYVVCDMPFSTRQAGDMSRPPTHTHTHLILATSTLATVLPRLPVYLSLWTGGSSGHACG